MVTDCSDETEPQGNESDQDDGKSLSSDLNLGFLFALLVVSFKVYRLYLISSTIRLLNFGSNYSVVVGGSNVSEWILSLANLLGMAFVFAENYKPEGLSYASQMTGIN